MQKVNVFVQWPRGESSYKSVYASPSITVVEILSRCGLTPGGASIYLNGLRLNKQQWDKQLKDFKTKERAFISLRYGEGD